MARVAALAGILALALTPALAGPVTQSLRPQPRPGATVAATPAVTLAAAAASRSLLAPRASLRPMERTAEEPPQPGVVEVAAPVVRATTPSQRNTTALCGNTALEGVRVKPVKGKLKGCEIAEPVQVTAVQGVRLVPPALLNCAAANALSDWVGEGLQPAFKGKIAQLNVADSYSCRPRNNVRGNPVSVHGQGAAIDIQAFVLKNGKTYSVKDNYGRQIQRAQKAACGTFTTTLGPGSDGHHEDHIHLDVSRHGGGAYCR